mgnify:CR=1 FL=1
MFAPFSTTRIFNGVYPLNDYSGRFGSLGNHFTNTVFIVVRLDQPLHQRFFDFWRVIFLLVPPKQTAHCQRQSWAGSRYAFKIHLNATQACLTQYKMTF